MELVGRTKAPMVTASGVRTEQWQPGQSQGASSEQQVCDVAASSSLQVDFARLAQHGGSDFSTAARLVAQAHGDEPMVGTTKPSVASATSERAPSCR